MTQQVYYYLDRFTDEICPCAPTLEGWAAWLANPDGSFGLSQPPAPGTHFEATALRMRDDLIATRTPTGWVIPAADSDANFFAIRYDESAGWDGDTICGDMASLEEGLKDYCDAHQPGDIAHIAVGRDEGGLIIIFDGVACSVERAQ